MSNTETAQPTSTRPTTLQEDYVIRDTINQPEAARTSTRRPWPLK